ncbi:hypothetical protein SFC08_16835 [Lysinibacillus halotolerans]
MYETVPYTLEQIVMMYVVFAGASIVAFPLLNFIVNAAKKGVSKWK